MIFNYIINYKIYSTQSFKFYIDHFLFKFNHIFSKDHLILIILQKLRFSHFLFLILFFQYLRKDFVFIYLIIKFNSFYFHILIKDFYFHLINISTYFFILKFNIIAYLLSKNHFIY